MSFSDNIESSLAITGLFSIVVVLVSIACSWICLQQFRFDLFLKDPKSGSAKLLQIFLSIALGYQVAKFLLDYFNWAVLLRGMF